MGNISEIIKFAKSEFAHCIIEIEGVDSECFSPVWLESHIRSVIQRLNLKVVAHEKHHFTPHGTTYAHILLSSHMVTHTWPEWSYIHIDLFSCKEMPNDKVLKARVGEVFQTDQIKVRRIPYG